MSDDGHTPQSVRRLVAAEILAKRHQRGLTQAELGKRCGMRVGTICRLESGRQNPSILTLQRVAQALGVALVVQFTACDK